MATLDSNKVTDVSIVSSATDAVNKQYIDELIPSTTGNAGKFLAVYPAFYYWVARTSGFGNTTATNILFANNLFVAAGGSSGGIQTSTDGIVWSTRTAVLGNTVSALEYLNNLYVVSGNVPYSVSTDAIVWIIRTGPLIGDVITYGNGTYLSGPSSNNISVSTDSINWTSTPFITNSVVGSGIFGNNLFVIGGYINSTPFPALLTTSTNGIVWTLRTLSGFDAAGGFKLVYGNNTYVAAGPSGRLATSTDTISWTLRTSSITTANYGALAYANNTYFLSSTNNFGILRTSTDAITWSIRTYGPYVMSDIAFGNNIYAATNSNGSQITTSLANSQKIWQSINSTTTTTTFQDPAIFKGSQEFTSPTAQTFYIPSTATQFYIEAIGGGGGGASGRYTGTLGSGGGGGSGAYNAWLIRRGELGNATTMTVTPGAGGRGGNNRGMSTSTNGIDWFHVQSGSGFGSSTIFTLMYDGTNYFAAGAGGTLTTSTDTIFWFQRTSGRTTQIGFAGGGNGLLYAAGQTNDYVYAGASGVLATSTNGIQWTLRTAASGTTAIQALAFGSLPTATYVRGIAALVGNLATSTDAINWTLRTSALPGGSTAINSLLYSTATTEYYIVGGNKGDLSTSTNAIQWTIRSTGLGAAPINQLLYGAVYVATGGAGRLSTSTDVITWNLRTSGTTQNLYGLAYNASATEKYLAAGASGAFLSSTDAITWTLRTSLFQAQDIYALTYGTTFVAGGTPSGGGSSGTSTTVTWTGNTPTGTATYTLTSAAGSNAGDTVVTAGTAGPAAAVTLNPLYRTAGLAGGAGRSAPGASNDSTQANSNQVTGGGGGAFGTFTGGSATTYYYGNTYTNGGSASGGNASGGIPGSYTGNIGGGGGGGGALSEGVYSWTMRTVSGVSFSGSYPLAATSGNSLYVVSLGTGSIITSTNTIAWTIRTNPGTPSSFVFANSTFVGSGGAKISSTNGIVWVIRTSPAGVGGALGFGNNFYLAGGASTSSLEISTNSIVWELRTSGFGSSTISAVTFGNSTYVIAGGAALATSTDTINWTLRTSSATAGNISSLSFGDNTFLCTSFGPSAQILSSTNAIQWTLRTVGTANVKYIRVSTYGNGYFSIGGVDDSANTQVFNMSTNAIVWEKPSVPLAIGFNDSRTDYYAVSNTDGYYILGGHRHLSTASTTSQSAVGNGGNATRGGGGGGGGYSIQQNRFGIGGSGGDGYVRITWW